MTDWNKIYFLLSQLKSTQISFMSMLLAIKFDHPVQLKLNTWQCLTKTPRLRTKTQTRSLKDQKPRVTNMSSDSRGIGLFMLNVFYRNFGVNTSWGGEYLLQPHSVSSWELWNFYWNTFRTAFCLSVTVMELQCVFGCSLQNILWRALLTQRFTICGAAHQFVLSVNHPSLLISFKL